MGQLVNIVTSLHTSTKRNYIERMMNEKVIAMNTAKLYEKEYWDGDRKFGYGGYNYIPGRWKPVAEDLIKKYKLTNKSKILDVGCGKGFLLYEIQLLLPGVRLVGFDISLHGLANKLPDFDGDMFIHRAQDPYPYSDNEFDLVISLGTLHNLRIMELQKALKEIQRVGLNKYVMVESYRNTLELFNMQCWALTAEAFFDKESWEWLFKHFNYSGDYEFFYFE